MTFLKKTFQVRTISFEIYFCSWNILALTATYSETMNPTGIFANNELDLQKIKVYGFDFGESLFSKLTIKKIRFLFE